MTSVAADTASPATEIAERLTGLIQHEIPTARDVTIDGLRRTSGGFSRENWMCDASWQDIDGYQELALILRRDPAASPLNTDRLSEFAILRALEGTAVPAPKVYWLDATGNWMGRPSVVMERMSGDCDWHVFNSKRPLDVRTALAREFTSVLTRIQDVDWKAAGLDSVLGHPSGHAGLAEIARWRADLDRVQLEPMPELDLVERWLRNNAPPPGDVVLVHGDYKPGNALIDGDRISAILDWETAHLGDPLEDLGWMTNPARRGEQLIAGFWERDQIVQEYETRTGRTVSEADLRWWIIFASWRLAITNLAGQHAFIAGLTERINQTPTWLFRRMFALIEEGN